MNDSYNDSSQDRPYRPRYQDRQDQGGYDGNRYAPSRGSSDDGGRGVDRYNDSNRSAGGGYGNSGGYGNRRRPEPRDEVYSKQVRAGKRRYFFDVRDTRGGDFYLTITEMKRSNFEGEAPEKHKLFLYKEDFTKFVQGLQDTIDYIKSNLLSPEQLDDLERGDAQYEEDERRWQEDRQAREREEYGNRAPRYDDRAPGEPAREGF